MAISVNAMRTIDHWVGVPLCAIASPIVALLDAQSPSKWGRHLLPNIQE
jgi:hypothetical protein